MVLREQSGEPLARFATMRTRDVGEAERVVAGAYVPHCLTADSVLDARLNVVSSGGITIGYLRYGADARLTVPAMVDAFHVNLTLTGTTTVRQARAEVRTAAGRSGVMISPTRPATVDWSADATQFAMKIGRQSLESQLSALLHDALSRPLRFSLAVDLQSSAGAALLTATRFLVAQLELHEPAEPLVQQQMESFFLTQVLLGIPNSYSGRLSAAAGPIGRFALDEAIDYIEAYPERPLGLAELATVAGTTASALRAAFRDELGTTPAEYVRAVRLARARAELLGGDPSVRSLSVLAARWGFPAVEQFAAQYQARYGQDPAVVLRSANSGATPDG
ncbi:AraC-like ligand-binding domain-containing protein [Geodermatophilus sp. SYSU D01105]